MGRLDHPNSGAAETTRVRPLPLVAYLYQVSAKAEPAQPQDKAAA